MDYFIDKTDKRFDKLEKKLDEIIQFRWQIVGGAGLLTFLLTVGINIFFKLKGM